MGTIDKALRIILAIVIVVLIFLGELSGVAAVVLGIIAAVFLLTSLIGFCPLYVPLGLSTCKKK